MALFRKKEENTDNRKDIKKAGKITKNLVDLKPENKKKRKEPPKPWGKKERILVLVALLATTVVSAILLISNSFNFVFTDFHFKVPSLNLNSINIFRSETIVINKNK